MSPDPVQFFRDNAGEWRFRIVARNGEIVAQSEGYRRRVDAVGGASATLAAVLRWAAATDPGQLGREVAAAFTADEAVDASTEPGGDGHTIDVGPVNVRCPDCRGTGWVPAVSPAVPVPEPDDEPTAIELAADEMLTALYRIRADRPSAHSDAVWSIMNHAIEVGQAAFDGRAAASVPDTAAPDHEREPLPYEPSPCGVCGGPDQRHRTVDAQMERIIAGERIDEVAADYFDQAIEVGRAYPDEVVAMVAAWHDSYTVAFESWAARAFGDDAAGPGVTGGDR